MNNRFLTYLFLPFFTLIWCRSAAQVSADFSANNTSGCTPLLVSFTDLSSGSATSWSWNFGNGNTSTLQHPSLIYTAPGVYTVTLTVKDAANISSTRTRTAYITVNGPPAANFSVNKTSGCPNSTFVFADLSTPNPVSSSPVSQWQWDFGDGQGSNSQNPSHTYTFPGTFTVKLTIKDANGCSHYKELTNSVTIFPVPKAQFTPSKTSSCVAPLTVSFNNTSQGATAYQWTFGDGNSSTQASPSNTYTAPGTYTVKLVTTNASGCKDSTTTTISIGSKSIDFGISPAQGCIDNPITFTPTTTGGPISYAWSFGNGDTSNAQAPSHTFHTPGSYNVSLVVSFADGCSDTVTKTITVDDIPDVKINYTPKSSCTVPFNATFTNSVTNATSIWNFGDGTTSTQKNVIHTYNSRGPFIVTLKATTTGGCSASRTDTIDFNPQLDIVPTQKQFCGASSATVGFTYTPRYTTPTTPVSWSWNFGDGGTSTLKSPSHTYTTEGTFLVHLAITYPGGCVIDGWDTIQVYTYPVPNFTVNLKDVCVKKTINFTNLSTNYDSVIWDFGDKIKKYAKVLVPGDGDATHQYRNPLTITKLTDTFNITLTVFNGPCMADTVFPKYIRVRSPLAYAEPVTLYCDTPGLANFTDISVYKNPRDSVSRLWVFGDAFATKISGLTCTIDSKSGLNMGVNCNRSVDSITTHKYTRFGDYNAYLRTYSPVTGCLDSFEFVIKVRPKYNLNFVESADTGCAPFTVLLRDTTKSSRKWKWDFGDPSTSSDTAVSKDTAWTFNRPGVYTITLNAEDTAGCTQLVTRKIYVRGPLANFGTTGKLCPPDSVQFNDLTVKTSRIMKWRWNFGDNASGTADTSSFQNPKHRFSIVGSYVVALTVTDSESCTHTIAKLINYGPPKPAFTNDKQIICKNYTIQYANNTPGGTGNRYSWSFGDGDTSNAFNPSHVYSDTGLYTVKLIARRTDGCSDSSIVTQAVRVVDPKVDFTADNTNAFCPPFTVHFNDSVTPDIIEWKWDFGDSSYSTAPNPIHTYNKPGRYTVKLWGKSAGGCEDSIRYIDYIKVGGPLGNFVFSPKGGCLPLGSGFKATTTGAVLYTWDFGDGSVSNTTTDSAYHTYTATGIFKPVLILTDINSCTIPYPSSDSVVILPASVANFSASDTAICIGGNVLFTDRSTTPAGVNVVSRSWDFGDLATATGSPVGHIYTTSGQFDVRLSIFDSRGCRDTIVKPKYITSTLQPTVTVTPDTSMCPGESIKLLATGGIKYSWFPATGLSASNIPDPVASPLATTTYEVTVKGAGNCDSIKAKVIVTVHPLPATNAGADIVLCTGDSAQLNASGGLKYTWTPGSGLSSDTIPNPFVKVSSSARYNLTTTDRHGCTNSDSLQVTVVPTPIAQITGPELVCYGAVITLTATGGDTYIWSTGTTGNPLVQEIKADTSFIVVPFVQGCEGTPDTITVKISGDVVVADFITPGDTLFTGKPAQFINTSQGAALYNWDFAWTTDKGRYVSTMKDPIQQYLRKGVYTVSLIVKSAIGCMDTVYKEVNVIDAEVYIPNAFTPNGDGRNDVFYFVASSPVDDFAFSIYNRWGEQVFYTTDVNSTGWNGTYKDAVCQQDVYVYIFEGKVNQKRVTLSGSVTLLR